MMLQRRTRDAAAVLILPAMLLLAAAEALPMPMEVYFTPAELARIAGYGEEPVSSVSVSGQLTCELCLSPGARLLTLEMPGAKVAVSCETERTPKNQLDSFAYATTDEYGNFTIDLPPQLHATPDLEKACTVRVLQLRADADSCRLRHRTGDTYRLRLSSVEDGVRAYTAGVIRLQDSDTPSDHCVGVEHMSPIDRWRVGDACFYVHKRATHPNRKATSRRAEPATDAAQRDTGSPSPPQHSGHGRMRTRHRPRCSSPPLHSRLRHPRSRGTTTIADWRYADAACFSSVLRMLMLDASKSIAAGPAASPKLPPPLPGPPASASTSRRLVYSTPPLLPLLLQLDGRDRTAARGGGWVSSASMVNNISCIRSCFMKQSKPLLGLTWKG